VVNTPQDKIIGLLKESKEPLSAADIGLKLGITKTQMNFYLQGLKQMGKVEAKKKAQPAGYNTGGLDQYVYVVK
jgi:predicted ArsR family transcriptional regulator